MISPAQEARARSQVYGLLARVFRAEPDETLVRHLQSPPIQEGLEMWGEPLAQFFGQGSMEQILTALAEEYARLFLGPGPHIALHESVLIPGGSGLLWGKETADVKRFMEEAGFALPTNAGMLPDHLSIGLEFMAHLCEEEAQGWLSHDETRARNATNWQADFLARHLGKWADTVKTKLDAITLSSFYTVFANILCSFVQQENNG